MEERTLEEAKYQKRLEINWDAESEFWSAIDEDGLFPMMSVFKILFILAQNRRALTVAERDRVEAAFAVNAKLKQKSTQIANATTVEQVDAITWGGAVASK